ncbi:hypothetical protein [Heyndrickxia sporothermodurans]|uniref:ATP-grasp domain-containing protein n=1 Tax=Heyndrickxia sporothermodurans TaxID=46224 RepID=UPI002E2489A1|nr:hypothetical protein [Heyndrickxia sporothermodurans]MED3696922.1 hypothetical protein [Heyndrickxia sporothermodurans]
MINDIRERKKSKIKLNENEKLESASPRIIKFPKEVQMPYVGLVKSEVGYYAYWPKFERILKNSGIPYSFIDIKRSTFIKEVEKFDIIVWRTPSEYSEQWEAKDKIEFIQNFMGKLTLPNKESLWFYEDKVRQQWLFDYYNLPSIKTFISHSREEVNDFINNTNYPIISKDKTSAGSSGVISVKNKKIANKIYREVFSNGMKLFNKYIRQKDYVLFQESVPNNGFDLRIIMVGNSYFGYYRYPKKGDFRASGSGILEKKEIPKDVLLLAKRVREYLPKSYLLAVDFLQDKRDQKYYIIETSIFVSIESSEQLEVNKVPGRYIEEDGEFTFEAGRFWLQELMIEEIIKEWIEKSLEGRTNK